MDSLAVPNPRISASQSAPIPDSVLRSWMGKIACDLKSFFSKTKKRKWEMGLSALDRSLHISHGRKPVDGIVSKSQPRRSCKIPRIHSNLSPLWGWDPALL